MKRSTRTPLCIAVCAGAMAAAGWAASASIDANQYLEDVKFLASQNLRGRGTGTPELEKAAAFIAGKFHSFGLQPVEGNYYQAFSVTTNARLGTDNRLAYRALGTRSEEHTSELQSHVNLVCRL